MPVIFLPFFPTGMLEHLKTDVLEYLTPQHMHLGSLVALPVRGSRFSLAESDPPFKTLKTRDFYYSVCVRVCT